jgi:pantoate--beta-alanine ligase
MYNTMMPDVFVLGQKDYQQNRVVERLTRDLDFDVEVVEAPTVREADGLAMSR